MVACGTESALAGSRSWQRLQSGKGKTGPPWRRQRKGRSGAGGSSAAGPGWRGCRRWCPPPAAPESPHLLAGPPPGTPPAAALLSAPMSASCIPTVNITQSTYQHAGADHVLKPSHDALQQDSWIREKQGIIPYIRVEPLCRIDMCICAQVHRRNSWGVQGADLKSSSRQWLRRDFSFWLYLSLQMQMMGSLAPFRVWMRSATPPLSPADMPSTSSMIRHICSAQPELMCGQAAMHPFPALWAVLCTTEVCVSAGDHAGRCTRQLIGMDFPARMMQRCTEIVRT